MANSLPPFHETAVLQALRGRALARKIVGSKPQSTNIPQNYLQNGGLAAAGEGMGQVPRGANFGTAFLSAAGGAAKAYQGNQALEAQRSFLQAKEDADQAEIDRRFGMEQSRLDEEKRHNAAIEAKTPGEEDYTLPTGSDPDGNQMPNALPPYLQGVPKALFKTAGAEYFQKKYAPDKPAQTSETLSDDALDMAAQMYAKTGLLPALGMKASGVREKILDRAAQLYAGVDVAGNKAGYGADTASLKNLQGNYDQTVAFGNTFEKNAQPLEQMVRSIPNLGTRFGNHVGRWLASQAGSPEATQFQGQLAVVRPEAQRILQFAGTGGNMALTDHQAKDMRAVLGDDFTPDQLLGSLAVLRQDRKNKLDSYAGQIEAIRSRIHNPGGQSQSGTQPTDADNAYLRSIGLLK